MQLELKLNSIEEFLTLLEALRGAPVANQVLLEATTTISEEVYRDFQESVDEALTRQGHAIQDLERETNVLRGALDETINEVRAAQTAARDAEPKGNGKRQPAVRGIYCRFCGRELDTRKSQKIFCSQACAGRWQGQHKGEHATPRLTLKDEKLGTTVVAGEGVRA